MVGAVQKPPEAVARRGVMGHEEISRCSIIHLFYSPAYVGWRTPFIASGMWSVPAPLLFFTFLLSSSSSSFLSGDEVTIHYV
ncbi:hypothetical protein TNIN_57941 [Trichonephila inaurata madagascariensis]|uniref:Uncharacterized protein n=1 Tax=Trichonephila inaurata madagascariensis TaxID=2747483 RepID=A0A8X7BZE9_9ARAC|nr:hypothetical protein TNIN_57941 [Trichonephila inaurata madagascariensis]